MIRLGILFGGRSEEHEVSRLSAVSVIGAIDRSKYDIIMIGITKQGEWMLYDGDVDKIATGEWEETARQKLFDDPENYAFSLLGTGGRSLREIVDFVQLKTHLITKEVNRLKGELGAIHYVGIAADEAWRCKDERYPLVEWGITEAQALQACYDRGFDFGGLYEIYHRASCWCCPFQRIDELRKLRKHHPELWEKLLELDRRALAQFGTGPLGQFKQNWSVKRLDTRFAEEDGQTG